MMKAAQPIHVPRVLGVGVLLLVVAVLVPALVRGRTESGPVLGTVSVGKLPGMVAVDASTNRAFVTNSTDHTVSMLDATNGAVLRTIALPGEPDLVTTDARTGRVFVLDDPDNTVSVLDAVSGSVLRTVPVTTADVAVDDQTGRVFVTGLLTGPGTLAMLDGHSGAVLHTTIVGGKAAWGVAVDARTNRAFVTNFGEDMVYVVEASTGRVVRTVAVGWLPNSVTVDAATEHVFVTNNGEDTVTMLDARNGTVLRTIKVGLYPAKALVDEHTGRVFVVHGRGGHREDFPSAPDSTSGSTMLDARSGRVLRALPVGGSPVDDVGYVTARNLALDRRRGRVFVINRTPHASRNSPATGSVSVLDARSGRLLRTLGVGRHPIALAVDETTARLFVVNTNSGCVRRSSLWDRVPGPARHWLPFLPAPSRPTCSMPGTVTAIDTSHL